MNGSGCLQGIGALVLFGIAILLVGGLLGRTSQERRLSEQTSRERETAPGAQWRASAWQSQLTDFQNHMLTVDALSEARDQYGRRVAPRLNVACREDVTSIWIDADEYVGIDELRVEIRIDSAQRVAQTWQIATSHSAFGLWRGRQAIPVIREMLAVDAERLTARYTPYGENPRVVQFDVSRLSLRIGPLRQACGW